MKKSLKIKKERQNLLFGEKINIHKIGEIQILTIAWDVDDVLNDLMRQWLEDFELSSNKIQTLYDDILENPPHEILGISLHEYLNLLDIFRLSNKAYNMKPNEEIRSWFEEKGSSFRHIALTATPLKTAHVSAYWVTKNFGKWINSFNFVPSRRDEDNFSAQDKTKKEFLHRIKTVDILIDDNKNNIDDAESLGIKGILVSRPWNTGGHSIKEALGILDKILENKGNKDD